MRIAAACIALAFLLAGCGSDDESSSAASTPSTGTSADASSTPSESSPKAEPNFGIGDKVKTSEFVITINKVYYASAFEGDDGNIRKPSSGGTFLMVDTTVKNIGRRPIDLTCDFALDIKVFNADSQQYDPVENLYDLKGNPPCSPALQPGFTDKITYPFMIPKGAKMIAAMVNIVSMGQKPDEIKLIALDPKYKGALRFSYS